MFSTLRYEDRVEMISVTAGSKQYIAEAPPETPHTSALWICTLIEDVDANTKVIKVKKVKQIPGTNGAGLVALWS